MENQKRSDFKGSISILKISRLATPAQIQMQSRFLSNTSLFTKQYEYLSEAKLLIPNIRKLSKLLILLLELCFSIGLPLILLLTYIDYAKLNGIKIENCCDGPGVSFGILSGIIFAFIQRSKCE